MKEIADFQLPIADFKKGERKQIGNWQLEMK